ncbi:SAM-dependent methyltransferase [Streptomyces tateyamensis]|uniref:SAM-dependent methyltransferase n=1 Tax=Streptomyces tateyamensis TaxID=565073 RepID=A0A2V4NQK1_9ACTN|nr:class I SAM-dependent methyltransferase [Streptomyces tateyamensis]PYC88045.1 SAM-dependent methyltransferase [Streptomyces tateyamensis]
MTTEQQTEEFWEGHYQQRERVWSGKVNPVFAEIAEPLTPGRALDLGCGEGADAVWLARHGWQVDAADISATALARAAGHAAETGTAERISFHRVDLTKGFPEGRFDLVSAQFLQSPLDFPRAEVLRRAFAALAPGGVLLVVDHAAAPPWSKHGHQMEFPTPQDTLAELGLSADQVAVERAGTVERPAAGPEGEHGMLTDGVLVLRRR